MTRQYMIAAFAVAACALALSAEAIDMSWTGKWQPCEKINLTDITTTPIGDTLLDDGGFELPTNATCIAQ